MPPGTGDVAITLSQTVSMSGALIVTSPHRLAMADVFKGIAMFQDVRVPTLAIVRNSSLLTLLLSLPS